MDIRLLEAAHTGNVSLLQQILSESPFILHTIALVSTNQNPLHVASVAGHVDFVKEVLRLKPDLAQELNQDGFSPLHLASANGYIEVVRELITVDHNLCRIRGREGITPLHLAAIRGKVNVLYEMLTCAECIEDVTIHKETALHLAVKYNQFEALKAMVDWVQEMNKEEKILNMKDAQHNTILHLATWRKQFQVVELLLSNVTTDSPLLEINSINHSGLTALDVLLIFPSEAGDREIGDTLRGAGAMRAKDIILSPTHCTEFHNQTPENPHTTSETPRSQTKDPVEYFKFKKGRDSPSEARSSLLIISVFVATTAFQVGLSPPGGVWQESSNVSWSQNNGTIATSNTTTSSVVDQASLHIAGLSIMGSQSALWFTLFLVFNTIGFTMSLSMINILTKNFPLQLELQICMIAMYVTYSIAMSSITPDSIKVLLTVLTSTLPSMLPLLITWFLRSLIERIGGLIPSKIRRILSYL